jgi:hypothetical protein
VQATEQLDDTISENLASSKRPMVEYTHPPKTSLPKGTSFLDIPAEIRNHIYRQLYDDLDYDYWISPAGLLGFQTDKRYAKYVQLFLVSRQVRREASSIFFGEYFPHQTLYFQSVPALKLFMQNIGFGHPNFTGELWLKTGGQWDKEKARDISDVLQLISEAAGFDCVHNFKSVLHGIGGHNEGGNFRGDPYVIKGEGWMYQIRWGYNMIYDEWLQLEGKIGKLDWERFWNDKI